MSYDIATKNRKVLKYMEDEIIQLLCHWKSALESRKPDMIASLYAENALLVPTLSNRIRHNRAEIRDYFVEFLQTKTVAEIKHPYTHIYGDIATTSGFYSFTFSPEKGDPLVVDARFTFVYRHLADGWLIVEHHSSKMPE